MSGGRLPPQQTSQPGALEVVPICSLSTDWECSGLRVVEDVNYVVETTHVPNRRCSSVELPWRRSSRQVVSIVAAVGGQSQCATSEFSIYIGAAPEMLNEIFSADSQ